MKQVWTETSLDQLRSLLYYSTDVTLLQKFMEDVEETIQEATKEFIETYGKAVSHHSYLYLIETISTGFQYKFSIQANLATMGIPVELVKVSFVVHPVDKKYIDGTFEVVNRIGDNENSKEELDSGEDNGMGAFISRSRSSGQTLTDKEVTELYNSIILLRNGHDAKKYHRLRILKTILESMTADQKLTRRRNVNFTVYAVTEDSEEVATIRIND